ncbi:MAG TPA: hypothetical protein VGN07_00230 [Steroidobacteraceae bacterium]|jgi:hypothetical protein
MAIWQFNVELIPATWLAAGNDIESLFGEEGFDALPAWAAYEDPGLEQRLGMLLPRSRSWNPAQIVWGSQDGNDIRLSRRHEGIGCVAVHFDLRNPNMLLIRAIADLARDLELAILVPEVRRIATSDVEALLRFAAESSAAHFVLDPQSFLSQLDTVSERAN